MRGRRSLPLVGISIGDVSGIGPEVVAKALTFAAVRRALTPVIFGDGPTLERFSELARFVPLTSKEYAAAGRVTKASVVAVTQLPAPDRRPGKPTLAGGKAQYAYVMAAIDAARRGQVDALCTAPVNKEGISRAGIPFMGHTEVLAEAFGAEVLMLMDGPRIKVALATNHVPIQALPSALTVEKLVRQLLLLNASFRRRLRRRPRIAVCGLNPHAGEGGLLGREEVDIIAPAIAQARSRRVDAHGPFAADGLFAQADAMPCDVALAMFHDQGLVAAKAVDFVRTVNVTLGLPVPRTSPDHGTAYGLAGTGKADATPMAEALLKAAELLGGSIPSPSGRGRG